MPDYVTCALHVVDVTDTHVVACTVASTAEHMLLPRSHTTWVHEPKPGGFETAIIALHVAKRHAPLVSVVREWREHELKMENSKPSKRKLTNANLHSASR
jgi:hypothetical protein